MLLCLWVHCPFKVGQKSLKLWLLYPDRKTQNRLGIGSLTGFVAIENLRINENTIFLVEN